MDSAATILYTFLLLFFFLYLFAVLGVEVCPLAAERGTLAPSETFLLQLFSNVH